MNVTDPCTPKTGIRQALEDGIITAGASFVAALVAVGGVPNWPVLYAVALPSISIFISTYALKRGIKDDN
jgi:hypothetical protein